MIVYPKFARHPVSDGTECVPVEVTPVLSHQDDSVVNAIPAYVVENAICSTIRIISLHRGPLSIVQRNTEVVEAICDFSYTLYLPGPAEPRQTLLAPQQFLHSALFEVALLVEELLKRFDKDIRIAQRLGDRSLFGFARWKGYLQRFEDGNSEITYGGTGAPQHGMAFCTDEDWIA